jgi:hypothetical protein
MFISNFQFQKYRGNVTYSPPFLINNWLEKNLERKIERKGIKREEIRSEATQTESCEASVQKLERKEIYFSVFTEHFRFPT